MGSFIRAAAPILVFLLIAFWGEALAQVTVEETVIEEAIESEEEEFRVVQVVSGLEHPWAVAWLPDGRMLVTERPARMQLVDPDAETVTEIAGLPEIHAEEDQLTAPEGGDQGGLLDVAVHPDYETNGWIYFTYSSSGDDDSVVGEDTLGTGTALARARLSADGTQLEDLETLYAQVPRWDPGRHYGSRIVFPGDGTVMFTIGDRGLRWTSQDLTDPGGSFIRINGDGGVPDDNPFVNQEPGNLRPEIYSFGHRNNQGVVIHPQTGAIWALDHGPSGGDLLYVVREGANYGWPQVSYGVEYSTGEFIGVGREAPGVEEPVYWWEESMAPSGLAYYDGEPFSSWQGNLFAGSLLLEQVHRLEIQGEEVVHEEIFLDGVVGRIRDVRQGPDGYLYVVTDEDDGGVYRIEQAVGEEPAEVGAW